MKLSALDKVTQKLETDIMTPWAPDGAKKESCSLPEPIDKELFRDIIFAVWVFKCQIELVLRVQKLEASVGAGPGTSVGAAGSVNINIYIFSQLPRVIQSTVPEK